MKKTFRFLWRLVSVCFIAFLIFLGTLFFREQRIPSSLINYFADNIATSNVVLRCGDGSFGFRRGLDISDIRVFDRDRVDNANPIVSIRDMNIDFFRREIRLTELQFLRLHDEYYVPGGFKERDERLEITLPQFAEFRLILEQPNILGLTPNRLTSLVSGTRDYLLLDDIKLDWPNKTHQMKLNGMFKFDLKRQEAHGEVQGLSTTAQIRPLLVALDVPSALPYMDAFTEITEPVVAGGQFDVNLQNNDFRMKLDLHPKLGRYNGVPLTRADGTLGLYVFTRGTNCNVTLNVDLSRATDVEGKNLCGSLAMGMTNRLVRLSYDIKSELAFRDILEIADFISPETLSVITCDSKPVITVKGKSGVSFADRDYNDLDFSVALAKGSFLDLQLRDLSADFKIVGERISFSRFDTRGKTGGRYFGNAWVDIPNYDESRMTFGAHIDCRDASLEELADVAKFDLGEHRGLINGWCEFSGPVATNYLSRINGAGSIKIKDGHLAQMKLFADLTKLLAEKVPGVSFLVNQTDASADYTIKNGVFKSDNVFIEGGLVSIKAWGSYDIPRDNLDFTVRVQFMKKESLLGTLLHPITLPFTKLLLEFKATGPLDNPKWNYINILERIL